MTRTAARIFVVAGLLLIYSDVDIVHSASTQEQNSFNMEEQPVKPLDVPDTVFKILRQDRYVRNCIEADQSEDIITAAWFVGSSIHLDGTSEADLVIQARDLSEPESPTINRCLLGANTETFWVFRPTRGGHEVLLEATVHSLKVLDSRTNGYRDIETTSSTAVSRAKLLFRFDGNRYRFYRKSVEGEK